MLMFATMAITEATCRDCRDWIKTMEALELGYPRQPTGAAHLVKDEEE